MGGQAAALTLAFLFHSSRSVPRGMRTMSGELGIQVQQPCTHDVLKEFRQQHLSSSFSRSHGSRKDAQGSDFLLSSRARHNQGNPSAGFLLFNPDWCVKNIQTER